MTEQGSHCGECGPDVSVDTDGCCLTCGRWAMWYEGHPCECRDMYEGDICPQCLHKETAMKTEILKPCPFCGKPPEITKHFKHSMWSLLHRCSVVGPISIPRVPDFLEDKQGIIDDWNTRAHDNEQ